MKPMTHILREKIGTYIKNGLDISDLIDDVDIRNENLSFSVISKYKIINGDISGCNFSNAKLGDPTNKNIFMFLNSNVSHCNFEGVKFVGKTFMRGCKANNCNFKNADVSKADYQHTDFTGSTFCNSIITIGTSLGLGCKFPKQIFDDLTQGWLMKIKVEE
jgi:uncharacterized protein YjbI with pentapeptide repeats